MVIYGLVDPREPDRIRYVGKTTKRIEVRRDQHVHDAVKYRATHLRHWLLKLAEEGVTPDVVELERCEAREDLDAAEIQWIAELQGLVNTTRGGTGGATVSGPWSEERRSRHLARLAELKAERGGKAWRWQRSMTEAEKELRRQKTADYWRRVREGELPRPRPGIRSSNGLEGKPSPLRGKRQAPDHAAKSRTAAAGKSRTAEQRENYRRAWTPERRAAHAEKIRQSHVQRREKGV